MNEIKSPIAEDVPASPALSGFVCVHQGIPDWKSARGNLWDCLSAQFGPYDDQRLRELAEQGWRCIPIEGVSWTAPGRQDLIEAIRGIDTHLHAASLFTQQAPMSVDAAITKFTSIKTALRLAREIVTKIGVRKPGDDGSEFKL